MLLQQVLLLVQVNECLLFVGRLWHAAQAPAVLKYGGALPKKNQFRESPRALGLPGGILCPATVFPPGSF